MLTGTIERHALVDRVFEPHRRRIAGIAHARSGGGATHHVAGGRAADESRNERPAALRVRSRGSIEKVSAPGGRFDHGTALHVATIFAGAAVLIGAHRRLTIKLTIRRYRVAR
jgi:hypothetical protein